MLCLHTIVGALCTVATYSSSQLQTHFSCKTQHTYWAGHLYATTVLPLPVNLLLSTLADTCLYYHVLTWHMHCMQHSEIATTKTIFFQLLQLISAVNLSLSTLADTCHVLIGNIHCMQHSENSYKNIIFPTAAVTQCGSATS